MTIVKCRLCRILTCFTKDYDWSKTNFLMVMTHYWILLVLLV